MKIKLAVIVITAALALFSIDSVMAADQSDSNQPTTAAEQAAPANPALGFGSGTNMGIGGGTGSATSLGGGFGSPLSGSGAGVQTFGGGFNPQTTGSGPLSNPSMIGKGGRAMGP